MGSPEKKFLIDLYVTAIQIYCKMAYNDGGSRMVKFRFQDRCPLDCKFEGI